MKKLIAFIIITFSVFILNSCFKANDSVGHDGRCTGSAPCSACTTCSRCGHCGSGGSCGACTGKSSGRSSSSGSSSKIHKSEKHKAPKAKSNKPPKVRVDQVNININSGNMYFAHVAAVRIYTQPSDKSKAILTVTKNNRLIKLQELKDWYKVKVEPEGITGYVKRKDVK
ncbi:SH3 domain-containing protein [Chryseobacterium sp. sg2396]|uniref:SH3 domain-containing protein n=1 Tax=Chryseobacterium sp. sg2396 TaxID=3276280 RepID=UPI0025CF7283|nr:SH3 domain-containing protein [uncultured Chryseobacterium sp.]